MVDRGKKDKGRRENQKIGKLTKKEKRKEKILKKTPGDSIVKIKKI